MDHGGGGAAPTGCYKCGRPGHWSRDCPSNPTSGLNNLNPNNNNNNKTSKSTPYAFKSVGGADGSKPGTVKSTEKPKKVPRLRRKLTPEVLLSNDGLGYVLRHFPKAFKYHGRGHEVCDLGNLLGLYAEWHSHLLPYYSFDQFVHKVEQVGTSKRVKLCMRDLRDKIANGGDPTMLRKDPIQNEISNQEQEALNVEDPSLFQDTTNSVQNRDTDDFQESMLHDIYEKATQETSQALENDIATADVSAPKELAKQSPDNIETSSAAEDQISEELKARIEANRLKALERAAARSRSSQAT